MYPYIREIKLQFTDYKDYVNNSLGSENTSVLLQNDITGWGDTDLGGIYHETINGLHINSIYTEGVFRLHRVSSIGVLNKNSGNIF